MENSGTFSNGIYTIKWIDVDRILIRDGVGNECIICGGDFEQMLYCLCAAYQYGRQAEYDEAQEARAERSKK